MKQTMHRVSGVIGAAFAIFALCVAGQRAQAQGESSVAVRGVAQFDRYAAGSDVVVAVVFDHNEGFHIWPAKEVPLPAAIDEFAIRAEIAPKEQAWRDSLLAIQWPEAHDAVVADPTGESLTTTAPTYAGSAIAFATFSLKPDAPSGRASMALQVSYQACNDTMCEMPVKMTVEVAFDIVPTATGGVENEKSLFAGYLPPAPGGKPPSQAATPATQDFSLFGIRTSGGGLLGAIIILALSMLGGFALNLTPCVLPVIPIKILTLTQHAASPGRALALGTWMALGVVFFWTLIGIPMALFGARYDPSRFIFGTWWVTLTLGTLIVLMGVGVMGLFTLTLPQAVYRVNPKADTAFGSFVFGIMAGVLGLPCFGFVAGGLLVTTAALGPILTMVIFVGLGLGMAIPYLVLSAKPSLLKFIPRTGPASDLVKQVMGLLLIAAAAFFLVAGIKGLLRDMPYLSHSIAWWVISGVAIVAAVWCTIRTIQLTKRSAVIVAVVLGSSLVAGAPLWMAAGFTRIARAEYLKDAVPWGTFTPAAFQQAIATPGKVVIVDFTADWCATCKAWKAAFLDRDPVRTRITQGDCILFEADLTSSSDPGWEFLQSLGRTAVPTLAFWGPGIKDPVILNAYTSTTVMDSIAKAAGSKAVTVRDTGGGIDTRPE